VHALDRSAIETGLPLFNNVNYTSYEASNYAVFFQRPLISPLFGPVNILRTLILNTFKICSYLKGEALSSTLTQDNRQNYRSVYFR